MKTKQLTPYFLLMTAFLLLFSPSLRSQDIDALLAKWEKRLKKENLISCRIKQTKKSHF